MYQDIDIRSKNIAIFFNPAYATFPCLCFCAEIVCCTFSVIFHATCHLSRDLRSCCIGILSLVVVLINRLSLKKLISFIQLCVWHVENNQVYWTKFQGEKLYSWTVFVFFLLNLFSFVTVGHYLLAANGKPLKGCFFEDGTDAREILNDAKNYPLALKFGRIKPTTNEKIMLASMFHS